MSYDIDSDLPLKKDNAHASDDKNSSLSKDLDSDFQSASSYHSMIPINPIFFGGGERQALLDEVVHLCQFGNNLVAVIGDDGIGKSSLIHQARIVLSNTAFCCFIEADDEMTAEDLFSKIVSQLDLPLSSVSTAGEMIATLRHAIADGNLNRVVVVIDDANELNDSILSALISLLQGDQNQHLHILMAGEEGLVDRLDQFEMVDVLVYDIELNPLTLHETKQYLAFKYDHPVDDIDEMFDSDQIVSIWDESEGIPLKINRIAERYLSVDVFDEEIEETFEPVKTLPLIHIGLLVVLLAALFLALIYMGGEDESDTPALSESTPIELPIVSPELQAQAEVFSTDQQVNSTKSSPEAEIMEAREVISDVKGEQVNPEVSKGSDLSPSPAKSELQNAAPVLSLPDAPAVVEDSVGDVNEKNSTVVSEGLMVELKKERASLKSSSEYSLTTGDKWLADLADDKYVLQVIAAGQKAGVEKFISAQPNKDALRLVHLLRNNQSWYVAVLGAYSSNESARQAINSLPQQQVNLGPWPRKASGLKKELAANRNK